MSHSEDAIERGRGGGAFAAIEALAAIDDLGEAANAYSEAMRTAYWTDKDLVAATAVAYAGVSRLLAAAATADPDTAYAARSAAKGLTYDLASFTWVGWDEPDIEITAADAAAGLAAARSNLAMAENLEKGDLAVSRAHWMLGAHLLTAGDHSEAGTAFDRAAAFADRAGAEVEVGLAASFRVLCDLAAGKPGAEDRFDAALDELGSMEDGDGFVAQARTARAVLGV
jgi:hypothetical protein